MINRILLVLMTFFACEVLTSSFYSNCINGYCFSTPGSNTMLTFTEAETWCLSNSSVLLPVTNQEIQTALNVFLSSASSVQSSGIYINAQLISSNQYAWYLVNGSHYPGNVYGQTDALSEHLFYGNLTYSSSSGFQLYISNSTQLMNYICQYSSASICPKTIGSIQNGSCYVKYDNETLTWFNARYRCYSNGGDLAQTLDFNWFNSSWLTSSNDYWVGVRRNNLSWTIPEGGPDAIYTDWSSGQPSYEENNQNQIYQLCICLDPNANPQWSSWLDCDCTTTQQFVCFNGMMSTIMPTTTLPTTAISMSSKNPGNSTSTSMSATKKLALALGIGLGVGVPLLIIIIAIVIVVVLMIRKRKSLSSAENAYGSVETKRDRTKHKNKDKEKDKNKDKDKEKDKNKNKDKGNKSKGNGKGKGKNEYNFTNYQIYGEVVPVVSAAEEESKPDSKPTTLYATLDFPDENKTEVEIQNPKTSQEENEMVDNAYSEDAYANLGSVD